MGFFADCLLRPDGKLALLLRAPIPMFNVIFSGVGTAKKLVGAGIDKRPETPSITKLMATPAIPPWIGQGRRVSDLYSQVLGTSTEEEASNEKLNTFLGFSKGYEIECWICCSK
jgi:hypothetical protein